MLLAPACRPELPPSESKWRDARQTAVRNGLPPGQRAGLPDLRFYPYDPRFRVRTVLEPLRPEVALTLATSDGRARPARRVGRLRLVLPGGEVALWVYRLDDVAEDHLFLPFRDAGAGGETYGAGRYVDVRQLPGGLVEVDLNRAYNPDCAYGIAASCPVTPDENTVPLAVTAGEMSPLGGASH